MHGLRSQLRRLHKSVRLHGAMATVVRVLRNLVKLAQPGSSMESARDSQRDAFDASHGVDTAPMVDLSDLDIRSRNWVYGVRYQPIAGFDFRQALNELSVPYEQTTFVDFGSGKGRAVLLAAALPFRKAIGVEFSHELVAIARRNVERFPAAELKCTDIEFHCGDASEYELPAEPLTLFLYNPFDRPVMRAVVHNVMTSYQQKPRRFVVLYADARHADLWDAVPFLTRVRQLKQYSLYDTRELRTSA